MQISILITASIVLDMVENSIICENIKTFKTALLLKCISSYVLKLQIKLYKFMKFRTEVANRVISIE